MEANELATAEAAYTATLRISSETLPSDPNFLDLVADHVAASDRYVALRDEAAAALAKGTN